MTGPHKHPGAFITCCCDEPLVTPEATQDTRWLDDTCSWCGWPFPPDSREGLERADCMEAGHLAACCSNCGSCGHWGHRSEP